jgi:hypothetical protein
MIECTTIPGNHTAAINALTRVSSQFALDNHDSQGCIAPGTCAGDSLRIELPKIFALSVDVYIRGAKPYLAQICRY